MEEGEQEKRIEDEVSHGPEERERGREREGENSMREIIKIHRSSLKVTSKHN